MSGNSTWTVRFSSSAEKEFARLLPQDRSRVSNALDKMIQDSTSDIDLIIVREPDKRFLDRLDEVYRPVQPEIALDVLVYTPEGFASMKERNSFVRRALSEGRMLYERTSLQ